MLQEAEQDGLLEVFDLRWKEGQTKVDNLENQEIIEPDGSKIFPDRDPNMEKSLIRPRPGDMILFQGGSIWHRVGQINGTLPRITFGRFLAPSQDGSTIYYWS